MDVNVLPQRGGVEIRKIYSSLTAKFLVSETPPCLSLLALEAVIELVIIPRAVVIISV